MITKLDSRHDGLIKMQDGRWYARRPLQQSDLSGIHITLVQLTNISTKALVIDGEEWKAADLIITPLDAEDIALMGLDTEKAARINSEIVTMPNMLTLKERFDKIEQMCTNLKDKRDGN